MIPRLIILAIFISASFVSSSIYAQDTGISDKHILRGGLLYYARQPSHIPDYTNTGDNPLGVFLGYKNHTYEMARFFLQVQYTSGKTTYTRETSSKLEVQSDVIAKTFSFFTGVDLHYLRWTHFSIYSGLSAGFSYIDLKVNMIAQDPDREPFSAHTPFVGNTFFLQLRVLAFEFKPTDHYSFFIEFNGGTTAINLYNSVGMAFGMNYHL